MAIAPNQPRLSQPKSSPPKSSQPKSSPLILIGASMGGPQAIASLLGQFPATCPACLLIFQHVSAEFAASLATWLQSQSPLPVSLAQPGAKPRPGQVLLARGNGHLIFTSNGTLAHHPERADLHYSPSIDLGFSSAAQHWPTPGIAMVLTGMGQDGAQGLQQLRNRGWLTLAQDPATAAMPGMPKAAIAQGAALHSLSLSQLARKCLER